MEIMEQLLFESIDKNVEKSILDDNMSIDIGELFQIIMFFNRGKYLKSISLTNDMINEDSNASFSPSSKNITVYINSLTNKVCESLKNLDCDNSTILTNIYFELIKALLHELEHSKQFALINSLFKNSLEKDILKLTIFSEKKVINKLSKNLLIKELERRPNSEEIKIKSDKLISEWLDLYYTYYPLVPMERLANLSAYSSLAKIYDGHEKYKFYFDLSNIYRMKTLLSSYVVESGIVTSPTIAFIQHLQKSSFKKPITFDWYSEDRRECLENVSSVISFEDRQKYGLPITLKELRDFEKQVKEKQRYLEKTHNIVIENYSKTRRF